MKTNNTETAKTEKNINRITLLLIIVGCITSLCLIFFFAMLYHSSRNSETPKIFKAEQIGATDSSVLLVWSSSEAAKEFLIRYRSTDSIDYTEFRTDKPFAAIHGLKANNRYKATVAPVNGNQTYEPVTVICNTSPVCRVTEVSVDEVTSESALVTWKYTGIDEGFTIVAYAVDKNGKRHLTSENVRVDAGATSECLLQGLLSELNYTVCVIPNTRYATAAKSTFTTEKYSKQYDKLNIIRFVVCENDSNDTMRVSLIKDLVPLNEYKTSTIINGEADQDDKINITLYITDAERNIISNYTENDVLINPENKTSYTYRTIMTSFKAPAEQGDYIIYIAFDGVTVSKIDFKVI